MKTNLSHSSAGWLLTGQVMHERVRPVHNRFIYTVFAVRLNLSTIYAAQSWCFGVNRLRPWSIWLKDYGPRDGSDLQQWARNLLERHGVEADGEIWLQTFPRVFGFVFNPVSFWLCHHKNGELIAMIAEVNNTFGDTHLYLLTAKDHQVISEKTTLVTQKVMHVSPFCAVDGYYTFRLRETDASCFVGIDYLDADGLLIKTSIGGYKSPLSSQNVFSAVLKQPFLTLGVVAKIHWQALKLWWKKVPFHKRPNPPLQTITEGDER